jgi:hypothetical protein
MIGTWICVTLSACGIGGTTPGGPNPVPSISAFAPTAPIAGHAGTMLYVQGRNFIPSSTVQWNGSRRRTRYLTSTELAVAITAADLALPTPNTMAVVNPAPGGGASPTVTVTPQWPKPTHGGGGLLIDAATDLASRSALDGFGGPLFAAWNPSPENAAGPGMKIMMFGVPAAVCPASTQGPLSTFSDPVLISDGYLGQGSGVPTDLRFIPEPMNACGAAADGLSGPGNVFFDRTTAWSYTASLGHAGDLLLPFTGAGQNGAGADANIVNTSVNYQVDSARSRIEPWAFDGRARIGASARVSTIQAEDAAALTQTKQIIGATFLNASCSQSTPGASCQIYLQFAEVIAESDVPDWSQSPPEFYVDEFLDPNEANLPVIAADLIPGTAQTVADLGTGLPLFTSRASPTQHAGFGATRFDVEIDFDQFENAIRIASALTLAANVDTDGACAQCVQVFGSAWNDPHAWILVNLSSQQEIYDESGVSGAILGGHDWIYAGAAP